MGHAGKVLIIAALALAGAPAAQATPNRPLGPTADVPFGVHVRPRATAALAVDALPYQGGPVMHTNTTHVIFWNPSNYSLSYDPGYQAAVTTFLTNVAADSHKATNVYSVIAQYTDTTGRANYDSTYAGAIQDADNAPANGCTLPQPVQGGPALPDGSSWPICLTQTQIENEVKSVVQTNGLPAGLGDLYFLVTPDGLGSCTVPTQAGPTNCSLGGANFAGAFCGYHTWINLPTPILYANIPYANVPPHCAASGPHPNGTADPALSTMSHEHNEAVSDPQGNAWIDSNHMEVADLCGGFGGPPLGGTSTANEYNEVIGTGHYFLPDEWSNDDAGGSTDPQAGCQPREETLPMSIAMPASVLPGAQAAISGTATDPDGMIVSYRWDFGDGSPPAVAQSVSHPYATDGVYPVTLTVTDVTGLQQSLTKALAVDHPPVSRFSVSTVHPIQFVPVTFSGTGSSDSDGSVKAYHWNFGDGLTATGARPTHDFVDPGTFKVTLTVTDNLGVSSSSTSSLTVARFPRIKTSAKGRALRISIDQPGTIVVGSVHKRLKKAGAVTITVPLSATQRRTLAHKHVLKLKIKVTFRPRLGPPVTETFRVTLHG